MANITIILSCQQYNIKLTKKLQIRTAIKHQPENPDKSFSLKTNETNHDLLLVKTSEEEGRWKIGWHAVLAFPYSNIKGHGGVSI